MKALGGILGAIGSAVSAAVSKSGGKGSGGSSASGGGASPAAGASGGSAAYDQWRKNNPNYSVSPYDDELARRNSAFADALMRYKPQYYDAYGAGNQGGMQGANNAMNQARAAYGGYLGGIDGSEYRVARPYTMANEYAQRVVVDNTQQANNMYDAILRQGKQRLQAQKQDLEASYDDAARQAYISYMQGQRDLPQQLSALGVTGGASESALIGARSAYENNRGNLQTARQRAAQNIDMSMNDLENTRDVQVAQYALTNADRAYDNYLKAAFADVSRSDAMAQNDWQKAYQEALLTGQYNGGQTLDAQQMSYQRALELAAYTGDYSAMRQFGWSPAQITSAGGYYQKR